MGDGVSGERDEADEAPAETPAETAERNLVVPGERRIGEGGGHHRLEPADERYRGDGIPQAGERKAAQLLEQKPGLHRHRGEADDGLRDVLNALQTPRCFRSAVDDPYERPVRRHSLPEHGGEHKA